MVFIYDSIWSDIRGLLIAESELTGRPQAVDTFYLQRYIEYKNDLMALKGLTSDDFLNKFEGQDYFYDITVDRLLTRQKIYERAAEEKRQAPPDRDLEPQDSDERYQRNLNARNDNERGYLAQDKLYRLYGAHDQLLHGADLFFADYRHRREQQRHYSDDERDDAGEIVILRFEVFVEPAPVP